MLVDGSYEISSCDDIELGIKRSFPLSFYSCYDDVKDAKALLVIISLGLEKTLTLDIELILFGLWQRLMMLHVLVWIITA